MFFIRFCQPTGRAGIQGIAVRRDRRASYPVAISKATTRRFAGGALCAALLFASTAVAQQPVPGDFTDVRQLPDGPRYARVTELIAAVNANDPEQVKKFIRESCAGEFRDAIPMSEHIELFRRVFEVNRGIEFYSIRQYDPPRGGNDFIVIVRSRLTDNWRGIQLQVEDDPPHRVTGATFSLTRPPKELARQTKLTEAELLKEFAAYVERLVGAEAFSGTVLIARNGQVLFKRAYGEACKNFGVPNKIDTRFNLGSMNKMFTAVAIAQLVKKGKLAFDDPISKYLSSDWVPHEVGRKIRIEHLLAHTSGLGSYFNEKYEKSSRDLFRTVDDFKQLVGDDRPRFEPGTDWQYSNTGFLLLGAIIEKVTGGNYHDHIRRHIYEPAEMSSSDSFETDKVVPNVAIGYSRETGLDGKPVWVNNLLRHVVRGGPAGGGYSTVDDLLRFDQSMRANKLVGESMRDLLWSPKPGSPTYGYGFWLNQGPAGRTVGHSGGFFGISADLGMYLDSGYTFVALSNYDQGATHVSQKFAELLAAMK
jgi:CubicO group peptidase (beta-lactamase class C family)